MNESSPHSKAQWGRSAVPEGDNAVTVADLAVNGTVSLSESRILPLREVRQRAEAVAVRQALAFTGGNISRAAELLGVTRPTLYDLMERIARRAPAK